MNKFYKKHWKILLFFTLSGLIGGFFTGIYLLESYPAEIIQQILEQGITKPVLGLLTSIQSAGYGLILGSIGIYIAEKIGLWKNERKIEKAPLIYTIIIAIIGGIGIIVPDLLYFGKIFQPIMDSYMNKPTISYIVASVLYGGVIEEVMIRLFIMSFISFLFYLPVKKKCKQPATWIFILANIISSLLFAAGHLSTTSVLFGLTPMIIFRCFLLNGTFGLLFGWLYRKYGLQYSMIAHAGCHIVSKLIWVLFV